MEEISMTHVDLITEQQQVKAETLSALSHCSRISSVSGVTWHLCIQALERVSVPVSSLLHTREREREHGADECRVSGGQERVLSRSWSVCGRLPWGHLHVLLSDTCHSRSLTGSGSDDIMLHCTDFCPITRFENESVPPPAFSQQIENGSLLLKRDFSVQ